MDVTPSTLISNPYVAGRPLTGPSASLYIGREDVFGWFEENLSGSRPSNALLLYGERRIGKTSTLYQLVEGERGSAVRDNAGRSIFPAYIDLQRLAGRPTDEWLRRLARDICQKVNTSNLDRSTPDSGSAGETAFAAFDRCIDRLVPHEFHQHLRHHALRPAQAERAPQIVSARHLPQAGLWIGVHLNVGQLAGQADDSTDLLLPESLSLLVATHRGRVEHVSITLTLGCGFQEPGELRRHRQQPVFVPLLMLGGNLQHRVFAVDVDDAQLRVVGPVKLE